MRGFTLQNYSCVPARHGLWRPGASDCKLPSTSLDQLCWDWFLPHRKQNRKLELGQKNASLISSCQLQLVSSFSSMLTPVRCSLWSQSRWPYRGLHFVTKTPHSLYLRMVIGSRLTQTEQPMLSQEVRPPASAHTVLASLVQLPCE